MTATSGRPLSLVSSASDGKQVLLATIDWRLYGPRCAEWAPRVDERLLVAGLSRSAFRVGHSGRGQLSTTL